MIREGDRVYYKPEWQDPGDASVVFLATEDEDGGRVRVVALLGLPINPTQIVSVDMILCTETIEGVTMDLLERVKADSTFDPLEVLSEKLTTLLSRMHDVMMCQPQESPIKDIVKSWRDEIVRIRSVLDELQWIGSQLKQKQKKEAK